MPEQTTSEAFIEFREAAYGPGAFHPSQEREMQVCFMAGVTWMVMEMTRRIVNMPEGEGMARLDGIIKEVTEFKDEMIAKANVATEPKRRPRRP